MLANILPGFREVRAPFAAGGLLFATVFIALHRPLREATERGELGPGLEALLDALGPRGQLAVAGVVVYLIGTVYVSLIRRWVRDRYVGMLSTVAEPTYFGVKQQSRWMSVAAPFSRSSLRRLDDLLEDMDGVTVPIVCNEIILGAGKRLLVANKDLYLDWERLVTEAEFRDAVTLPAATFAAVALVGVEWAGPWKFAAGIAVVMVLAALFWNARRLDREANSMHAHVIADGIVTVPQMDRWAATHSR